MKIHSQLLSKNGLPIFVILPYEEYQNILEKCEDIEDIKAIDEAEKDRSERFPLALVEAIASGENAIKVFREYRKISQAELSRQIGISRQYISQLENGSRVGSTKILKAIAKTLKVDLEDIT